MTHLRPDTTAGRTVRLDGRPQETKNLADDPKFPETLKQTRDRLERWMHETTDQGASPESPGHVR